MDIVFMGTPEYAVKILRAMAEFDGFKDEKSGLNLIPADNQGSLEIKGFNGVKFNIKAVLTQPDKPVGRKQILTPSEVKIYAQNHLLNTPIFTPKSLKDEAIIKEICALKPDFIVVAAYGKILPQSILDIAPCINLHASILPKFRGASPIQSAILADKKQTGVTAMLMQAGLDRGDMLSFIYTSCEDKMASELFSELGDLGGELIIATLLNFSSLKPVKQDDKKASECKKIQKSDGVISFNESAREIYNKFRAFTPWPSLSLSSGLKLLNLELLSEYDGRKFERVGEVLSVKSGEIIITCKSGALRLKILQEPGKKPVSADAYLNGKRLGVGSIIS